MACEGRRRTLPPAATVQLGEALQGFRRQALHAARLAFQHPRTGKDVEVTAPVPADFEHLLAALRADLAALRADLAAARAGGAGERR